jgi:hypothetical protein
MRLFMCNLAVAGILVLAAPPAEAQVADILVPAGSGGAVEVTKPFFEEADDLSSLIFRGTFFMEVGARSSLFASVPLVYASSDGTSSTMLGNPEVGIALRTEDGEALGSVSLTLPLAQEASNDDFATMVGFLADNLHADRYGSEVFSVNGMLTPGTTLENGARLGFKVGASVWIPTGDDGGDAEIFARYGAFFSHSGSSVRFAAELNGFAIVSEDDLSVSARTLHELALSVGRASGSTRPEVFVRVPLDEDTRDFLTANLGVRLIF